MATDAALRERRRSSYRGLTVQPKAEAEPASPVSTPPRSAPPLSKHMSMPFLNSTPFYSPQKKRPRFFSEDLHTRARRFGTPLTVLVTTNPETSRRQLEVVLHVQCFRKGSAPLVFIMELRRLLFWAVLLCACVTSAGAFRAVPRSVPPQMTMAAQATPAMTMAAQATPAALGASSALNGIGSELGHEMGKARAAMSRLHTPLMEEISQQVGKLSEDLGADSFDVSAVASQLFAMVSDGELSMEKTKAYFTRACMSALMHKVVGSGITLASCLAHMPQ